MASSISLLRRLSGAPAAAACCAGCAQFRDTPAQVESRVQGLRSLGSAYSSVRAGDGICLVHDRYVAANSSCASHLPRAAGWSDRQA